MWLPCDFSPLGRPPANLRRDGERAGDRRRNDEPAGVHSIQRGQSLDVIGGIGIVVYTFPTVRTIALLFMHSLRTATGLAVSISQVQSQAHQQWPHQQHVSRPQIASRRPVQYKSCLWNRSTLRRRLGWFAAGWENFTVEERRTAATFCADQHVGC